MVLIVHAVGSFMARATTTAAVHFSGNDHHYNYQHHRSRVLLGIHWMQSTIQLQAVILLQIGARDFILTKMVPRNDV